MASVTAAMTTCLGSFVANLSSQAPEGPSRTRVPCEKKGQVSLVCMREVGGDH